MLILIVLSVVTLITASTSSPFHSPSRDIPLLINEVDNCFRKLNAAESALLEKDVLMTKYVGLFNTNALERLELTKSLLDTSQDHVRDLYIRNAASTIQLSFIESEIRRIQASKILRDYETALQTLRPILSDLIYFDLIPSEAQRLCAELIMQIEKIMQKDAVRLREKSAELHSHVAVLTSIKIFDTMDEVDKKGHILLVKRLVEEKRKLHIYSMSCLRSAMTASKRATVLLNMLQSNLSGVSLLDTTQDF